MISPTQKTTEIFRFGLIADPQYADEDDAYNFDGSHKRYYRATLSSVEQAVSTWNSENVPFVMQLGDIIDGKCQNNNNSQKALETVLEKFKQLKCGLNNVYHALGNHELYNFSRSELSQWFGQPEFYYEFSPVPGFRFIVLNSYEKSVIWKNEPQITEDCYDFLSKHNPNPIRSGILLFFFVFVFNPKLNIVLR